MSRLTQSQVVVTRTQTMAELGPRLQLDFEITGLCSTAWDEDLSGGGVVLVVVVVVVVVKVSGLFCTGEHSFIKWGG